MKGSLRKYFSQKIRFSTKKSSIDEDGDDFSMSRISIILVIISFILFIAAFSIYFTLHSPLANYIPGFHGKKAQMELVAALQRLDSLNNEVSKWETYNNHLQLVLDGGNSTADIVDSLTNNVDRKIAPRVLIDSIFREKIAKDTAYIAKRRGLKQHNFEIFPPCYGMITSSFNPEQNHNGITIQPTQTNTISSIMDGTVISSTWEPSIGWSIYIQHAGGLISIYKGLSNSILEIGQRVESGETIGYIGTNESAQLTLELWYSGYAVDPENYISF